MARVRIVDPFWQRWRETVVQKSLPHQWRMMEETGRLENFRKAAAGETSGHVGMRFNDSDLYKWMEAAALAEGLEDASPVSSQLDEAIQLVSDAQQEDGYLFTYTQLGRASRPWIHLAGMHEMYCAGHLIEAGVAHAETTRRQDLLGVGLRFAEHIASRFGPGRQPGMCGHQEIELALCRLERLTPGHGFRDLARWMVELRGTRPSMFEEELRDPERSESLPGYTNFIMPTGVYTGAYHQDDKPLAEQTEPVGHAVRAMYYYIGALDAYDEAPPALAHAMGSIWRSLVYRRMYVTGGIGSSGKNEGFTGDYDLPNQDAYAETCAAIGLIWWASRMATLTGQSEPLDVMERVLYNAALSGIGIDGTSFFYDNPLSADSGKRRQEWFSCACCPPNIARLILGLGPLCVRETPGEVEVRLLIGLDAEAQGGTLQLRSELPWGGRGILQWHGEPARFRLRLRKPGWADSASIRIQGAPGPDPGPDGYWTLDREWTQGDTVEFELEMRAQLVQAHPAIADCRGRVAAERGPLVYCLEEADLGAPVGGFSVDDLRPGSDVRISLGPARRGLEVEGRLDDSTWDAQGAYAPARPIRPEGRSATLIPYFAWANRAPGSMQVWLRRNQ